MNTISKIISATFLVIVFTTCTKNDNELVSDAASIELLSGDNQTAKPGEVLKTPIEVLVKDQFDLAFAETIVYFSVTEGSVSSSRSKTDARGIASVNWTLGTSTGTQDLEITAFKTDGNTALLNAPLFAKANVEEETPEATSLNLVSGNNQTGLINEPLEESIVVLVKDMNDDPLPGATVTVLVNDGSVASSALTTDANGLATITWTLGDVIGEQSISVMSFKPDGTTALTGSPLTIRANGSSVPAMADSLELVSGNNQTGTVSTPLANDIVVRVLDQFENPLAGAAVTVLVNDGSVASSALTTDANGLATITWTLGDVIGEQSISVMSFKPDGTTPLTGSPLTILADANAAIGADILLEVSGNNQTGTVSTPLANDIVVRVLDQFENPLAGAAVTVLVNDGSVASSALTTDANGFATITWTLGATLGTQTISVMSFKPDGTTPLTGSPLTILADATAPIGADILLEVSGNNQTGTVSTPLANDIVVRVLDQFENPFAGAAVTVLVNDGSVASSALTTDANGFATITWTLGATLGTQTISVMSFKPDGTTPLTGSPLTILADATAAIGADILLEVSGNNQTGTVSTPLANDIVVRVLDQFENPFAGAAVTVLVNDGSVASSALTTDANGFATITWTLGATLGTQTISVMSFKPDGTTPLTGSPLTILADATAAIGADILLEVSGNNQTGTVSTPLANDIVVRVLDQFENPFAGAAVTVLVNDGSVASSALTTDANGFATITWTLGATLGTQTISVMSFKPDGTTPLTGSPLTILADANVALGADILLEISGNNQTGTVNTALANDIVIRVLDQFENPFAGAAVTVLVNDGSVASSALTTDANGFATISWTLDATLGTQTISVMSFKPDGTTPLTGSPLTIFADANAAIGADILLEISGNNQTGTVNTALANDIVVRVLDQFENPFAGAAVNVLVNDGSVASSALTTDANGFATISWTLGATLGTQTISVMSFKPDGTTPLTGSPLTILADANAAIGADILLRISGGSQEGIINTALTDPLVVRVLDQFEQPFAGATVFFTPNNGSVSKQTVLTNSNGEAQTAWTLGPEVTDQSVTVTGFKADGITPLSGSPVSFFVSARAPLAIGDFHEGGVIFYLDNSGEHGMVCAISNQAENAAWGCTGTLISGADGTTIGSGAQNTLAIIAGCAESLIAAEWCSSLVLNGHSDWFLPSQAELNQIFLNKTTIDATAVAFGGTALNTNFYWSSTQMNANQAWGYNVFDDDFKNNSYSVRAVRSF